MTNTFRKINHTTIHRYKCDGQIDTDSAFRIYKSSPGGATLQVRGPLLKADYQPGIYGIIASARLNREELTILRDGINASLAELEKQ